LEVILKKAFKGCKFKLKFNLAKMFRDFKNGVIYRKMEKEE